MGTRYNTRAGKQNYSYQQKKLTTMVQKGMKWDDLYEKVIKMQQKGLLPKGTAARSRAIAKATKDSDLRAPGYENKRLKSRPRRLTADSKPTRMESLPRVTRERLYRDAIQICNYEEGEGVTPGYIKSEIQDDNNQVFLTRNVDGTIVSFLLIDEEYKDPKHAGMKVAEVNLICAQRGGGLKLLEQAKRYYASKDYDLMRLEAVPTAVAAYRRGGYKTTGEKSDGLSVMIHPLSKRIKNLKPKRKR